MNTQEWLAFITLLIAIVGAVQTIVVSYFGRAAKSAAVDASTVASTAAAQVIRNTQKLDEVKTLVNGQTVTLIEHNQELRDTLQSAGITPPPAPLSMATPPPDVIQEPPTGG